MDRGLGPRAGRLRSSVTAPTRSWSSRHSFAKARHRVPHAALARRPGSGARAGQGASPPASFRLTPSAQANLDHLTARHPVQRREVVAHGDPVGGHLLERALDDDAARIRAELDLAGPAQGRSETGAIGARPGPRRRGTAAVARRCGGRRRSTPAPRTCGLGWLEARTTSRGVRLHGVRGPGMGRAGRRAERRVVGLPPGDLGSPNRGWTAGCAGQGLGPGPSRRVPPRGRVPVRPRGRRGPGRDVLARSLPASPGLRRGLTVRPATELRAPALRVPTGVAVGLAQGQALAQLIPLGRGQGLLRGLAGPIPPLPEERDAPTTLPRRPRGRLGRLARGLRSAARGSRQGIAAAGTRRLGFAGRRHGKPRGAVSGDAAGESGKPLQGRGTSPVRGRENPEPAGSRTFAARAQGEPGGNHRECRHPPGIPPRRHRPELARKLVAGARRADPNPRRRRMLEAMDAVRGGLAPTSHRPRAPLTRQGCFHAGDHLVRRPGPLRASNKLPGQFDLRSPSGIWGTCLPRPASHRRGHPRAPSSHAVHTDRGWQQA